jgi:HK97 family phage major capsid protein
MLNTNTPQTLDTSSNEASLNIALNSNQQIKTVGMFDNVNFKDNYEQLFLEYLKNGFASEKLNAYLSQMKVSQNNGYPIAQSMQDAILDNTLLDNPFRKFATAFQSSQYTTELPVYQSDINTTWTDGNSFPNATEDRARSMVKLHDLTAHLKVTSRLVHDPMYDIKQMIVDDISRAFSQSEMNAFINGEGEEYNQPMGILNDTKVEMISSTQNAVSFNDLLKLYSLLDNKYETKTGETAFIMSKKTLMNIRNLKDDAGRLIFQQSLSANTVDSLLGFPVYCANMLDSKIAFGNIKQGYAIVDKIHGNLNGYKTSISIEVDRSERPFIKYAATESLTGLVINSNAFKILNII